MTGALIKERGGHFETQGSFERVSYEDGCGDWSDAFASQGTPKFPDSHQKLGERHGMDAYPTSPPKLPERTNPDNTLIL